MLHAFNTDDFLKAVDDFDRHARQGRVQVTGNFCRTGTGPGPDAQALRQAGQHTRFYPALGQAESALAVCRDLWALGEAQPAEATSLVAVFKGPAVQNEGQFESLWWQQLQAMHGVDAPCFDWNPAAKAAGRSLSVGGRAWQVQRLGPIAALPSAGATKPTFMVFKPVRG